MRLLGPPPPLQALTPQSLVPLVTRTAGRPRSSLRPKRPSEPEAETGGRRDEEHELTNLEAALARPKPIEARVRQVAAHCRSP